MAGNIDERGDPRGGVEDQVDSTSDERMDEDALAAIKEAENQAPDPSEFGLRVDAPLGDVAIRAENLGIRYNLNFTKKTKLRTTFAHALNPRHRNAGHFWAIRGVDLTIRRGEAVGIVGANGSGKSTTLLALAGILQPSEGSVETSGHISTLLSLNAGFDAELTGRENIALAGALLGIDPQVMEDITPGVIRFANIGAFIDAPMKTYSSGMKARVGFAIATSVDPDILLLDEVLQTGDNTFKEKSRRRIVEVLQTAKAVVMVTHDMSWITAFCNRAILMDKGKIIADGDPEEIADRHEQDAEKRAKQKRKAKQLMVHGLASQDEIAQARKEGTLETMIEQKSGDVTKLKAEQYEKTKAKRVNHLARLEHEAEEAQRALDEARAKAAVADARYADDDDGVAGESSTETASAGEGPSEPEPVSEPEPESVSEPEPEPETEEPQAPKSEEPKST